LFESQPEINHSFFPLGSRNRMLGYYVELDYDGFLINSFESLYSPILHFQPVFAGTLTRKQLMATGRQTCQKLHTYWSILCFELENKMEHRSTEKHVEFCICVYVCVYVYIYIVTWRLKAAIEEPDETSIARQRLGKQVSAATDTQETLEELLGTMFYIRCVQSGCREEFTWE
jgi:hypothetical protein